jgi:hypothetical protein
MDEGSYGRGDLKRREFITLLGGAAAAWPLAARAQQAGKLPIIGFFSLGSAAAVCSWVVALVQRLSELGWMEGRTVAIEYRWADGRNDRLAEIAAELVRPKVDVSQPILICPSRVPSRRSISAETPWPRFSKNC